MTATLDILPLAILGALLGLDVVSFPQAMISRPLVAATLGGAVAGDAMSGLLIGAILELIALDTLPFGASRYPEWGSASVVAGALFAVDPTRSAAALAMAVLGGLATAWVGGWSMVRLRELNARWARSKADALEAGARGTVIGLQLRGLTADLARAGALTAIAALTLGPVARAVAAEWTVEARLTRAIVIGVAGTVAAAAAWRIFHITVGARWLFIGGLAVGILLAAGR
jgi:mannose/fructose/N-acetylgalactosamine-specific phosphotransferase system component IIC